MTSEAEVLCILLVPRLRRLEAAQEAGFVAESPGGPGRRKARRVAPSTPPPVGRKSGIYPRMAAAVK